MKCPIGWQEWAGYCYMLVQQEETYGGARAFCQVIIKQRKITKFVNFLFVVHQIQRPIWAKNQLYNNQKILNIQNPSARPTTAAPTWRPSTLSWSRATSPRWWARTRPTIGSDWATGCRRDRGSGRTAPAFTTRTGQRVKYIYSNSNVPMGSSFIKCVS